MSDLSALFALDPFKMTDADVDAIIAEFRSRRHQFNAGNDRAGSTKPLTEKQKEVSKLADKVGLKNLDL